jgi:hypothetical protein
MKRRRLLRATFIPTARRALRPEPQARLDVADVERQIAWYKAQGLIAKGVNARAVVDLNFVK